MFLNVYKQTFHMSHVRISQKSKMCFNTKSSTYYFHMKTKLLTDFQICISVPLTVFLFVIAVAVMGHRIILSGKKVFQRTHFNLTAFTIFFSKKFFSSKLKHLKYILFRPNIDQDNYKIDKTNVTQPGNACFTCWKILFYCDTIINQTNYFYGCLNWLE